MCKTLSKTIPCKVDGGVIEGDSKRRHRAASYFHAYLPRGKILSIRKPWRTNFHRPAVVAIFWLCVRVGVVVKLYIHTFYRCDFLIAFVVCGGGVRVADRVVGGDIIPAEYRLVGGFASFGSGRFYLVRIRGGCNHLGAFVGLSSFDIIFYG